MRQGAKGFEMADDYVIGIGTIGPTEVIDAQRPIALVGTDRPAIAIPVPGHTRGSVAYLFDGVLFVGDALEYKQGRLELPAGPFVEDEAASLRSIAQLPASIGTAELRIICTGHGGCTPPGTGPALLAELVGRL